MTGSLIRNSLISGHAPGCGITEDVSDWMDRVQNSAVTEGEENKKPIFHKNNKNYDNNHKSSNHNNNFKSPTTQKTRKIPLNTSSDSNSSGSSDNINKYPENSTNYDKNNNNNSHQDSVDKQRKSKIVKKYHVEDFKYPYEKYTKEANFREDIESTENWHEESHERVRRAAQRQKDDNRNTCSLYIQTDPLIWRHVREGVADVSFSRVFSVYESYLLLSIFLAISR